MSMHPPAEARSVPGGLAGKGPRVSAADLLALVREAQLEELPALVGRLREAELVAELRLRNAQPTNGREPHESSEPERRLTPAEAAAIVGAVSPKWILRHTKGLRFRRDLSRKVVRFEEGGLRRWAAARRS